MRVVDLLSGKGRLSYSQCGEDLIIDHVFRVLGIRNPTYLDIGAHDPRRLNNTYLFYWQGCKGVCVEPNPSLYAKIARIRPRDCCLNVGIVASDAQFGELYVLSNDTLSTFSQSTAQRYVGYGRQRVEKQVRVPTMQINSVIDKYLSGRVNLISLDTEGTEVEIIESLNLTEYRPEVMCVETLTYSEDGSDVKIGDIVASVVARGYVAYADTHINTIFVEGQAWHSRMG